MPESSVDVLEDNDKIRLYGMIISTDEAPIEELHYLEKRFVNHNVIHKHVTPSENPHSEVVAQVDETEIKEFVDQEDGKTKTGLFARTSPLFDITPFHKKTIEYVSLKDKVKNPIKFSVQKQKFGNKGEVPKYSVPIELTLTTIPYCEKCVASVEKMENEKELARINELENALKTAIGKADKFEKEITDLKADSEIKSTADTESLEKRIETIKKSYADQVQAVTTKMENMEQAWETEKLNLLKTPILAELSKYEKDPWLAKHVYPSLSLEQLQERVTFVKENTVSAPAPHISRMEQSRNDAMQKVDDFHTATVERLEKQDPLMAKLVRGEALTPEEKRILGV